MREGIGALGLPCYCKVPSHCVWLACPVPYGRTDAAGGEEEAQPKPARKARSDWTPCTAAGVAS